MVGQDIRELKELLEKIKKGEAEGNFERIESLDDKFTKGLSSQKGTVFVIRNHGKIKRVVELKNDSLGDDLAAAFIPA